MNEPARTQRLHARYTVSVGAEVVFPDGTTMAATTENLSEGGVCVLTRRPLSEGARLRVALFLAQDGVEDPDAEPFEVAGSVRWIAERDVGQHAAGIRFEAMNVECAAILKRFLLETT
jgi:c-di-GMP-binding flagellar brake protein YcgR